MLYSKIVCTVHTFLFLKIWQRSVAVSGKRLGNRHSLSSVTPSHDVNVIRSTRRPSKLWHNSSLNIYKNNNFTTVHP